MDKSRNEGEFDTQFSRPKEFATALRGSFQHIHTLTRGRKLLRGERQYASNQQHVIGVGPAGMREGDGRCVVYKHYMKLISVQYYVWFSDAASLWFFVVWVARTGMVTTTNMD
jgi:hypothetical protein